MATAAASLPHQLFSWWLKELQGLLPARLFRRGGREAFILEIGEGGEARLYARGRGDAPAASGPLEAVAEAAREHMARARGLVLRLPASAVFCRTTSAPVRAFANLRAILELETAQATPFTLDDVVFDFLTKRDLRNRDALLVRQVIARKDVIEAALAATGSARPYITRIDAVGVRGVNLFSGRRSAISPTLKIACIAVIVSTAALVAATEARQTKIITALESQNAALEAETADTRSAAAEARIAVENSSALVERMNSQLTPLEIITALTEALPADSWITEMSARRGEATISGYAESASAVIAAIEASNAFSNVVTVAPITTDESGKNERYSLKFAVASSPDRPGGARVRGNGGAP